MADIDALADAFLEHVEELEDQYGIELDDNAREQLLVASVEAGFTPEATESAFAAVVTSHEGAGEDGAAQQSARPAEIVGAAIERVTESLGRPLLRAEHKAVAAGLEEAAVDFTELPASVVKKTLGDMAQQALDDHHKKVDWPADGHVRRVRVAEQRLWEEQNPDPEDDPRLEELDLDDPEDMRRYQVAKLQGVEFDSEDTSEAADDQADARLEEAA